MRLDPSKISPSQDFLKPETVRFIFNCIENQREDELPPTPIVREDQTGHLVAIDGHNLLAVRAFLGQETEVHVASSPGDGLVPTSEENQQRNTDLLNKFDICLIDRENVAKAGIQTFGDLIERYRDLFGLPA